MQPKGNQMGYDIGKISSIIETSVLGAGSLLVCL